MQFLCIVAFIASRVGMVLSVEKTCLNHHEKGVMFLGYHIYGDYGHKIQYTSKQKIGNVVLKFAIPLKKLIERFADRGFFMKVKSRKLTKYVGRRFDKWLFLNSGYEIILRFNSVINGIQYYYSGSTYRSVLDEL